MRFLIVDDDLSTLDALATGLRMEWQDATVLCAADGERGWEYFQRFEPDLVILDIGLPGRSGTDVLQSIRRVSDVPVILLTAKCGEIEQVRGLALGADDFVQKPYSHVLLTARIRSLMRRTEAAPLSRAQTELVAGDLTLDFERSEVKLQGQPVRLTPIELRLLFYLARNEGRVLSHQDILDHVWGRDYHATPEYLKVFISRVRAKVQPTPDRPQVIENERGIGYRFVRPSAPATAGRGKVERPDQSATKPIATAS